MYFQLVTDCENWFRHRAISAKNLPESQALGKVRRTVMTEGATPDCRQALPLIEDIEADYLLADRAYDTDTIIGKAKDLGMAPVIPPKKNRKNQRCYDKYLYKLRHLVENAFLAIKRWRGIATRYAKNASTFLAAVQIRCILLWAKISLLHSLA